jgi:hypothetical protein
MIFPMTGLVRLFGFFRITVNRLTRSTSDVTFVCPSLLFKQHQITLPMSKLATMGDVIRAEQDADIAVKLGLLTFARTAWRPVFRCRGRYHHSSSRMPSLE